MNAVTPGSLMAREISEQPQVMQRVIDVGLTAIADVRAQVLAAHPRFVLIAARGSSDHAALYAKYLIEIHLHLPVGLVSASAYTLYGARLDLRDTVFLAISQSGASPDLIESLESARESGAVTVAVTNSPGSPLAAAAHHHVDILAGLESSVAATKTYTAELLALYILITGLTPSALPEAAARTLDFSEHAYAAAERLRYADRLVTTARGYSYATARESALKLMETSYLSAQAFSAADLMHGPFAIVGSAMPVIAITTPGIGGTAMAPVVARLREAGADVLCVGEARGLPVAAEQLGEELSPLVEILPLQQLAWRLALDRGHDPDRPRALTKLTQTW